MKEPTILVTGGAGYIGAHICKRLAQEGFVPVTYDNLSTGHAYAVKWGPFVHASLSDHAQLQATIAAYKPKAVIHFAASALVVESMHDPGKYYHNVANSLSLLEAMRDGGVPYLVFSSSCATYGNPLFTPMTENHPQAPINPYGHSKLMVEQMIRDFDRTHGLKAAMLRYFNAAGADLNTEIGENHSPETHIIPSIIQTALGLKPEVVVYGTDFPTRDGSAIRDYIHVQDLAEAHVSALKWLLSEQKSIAVNLGTGTGFSVFEIIEAIQKHCSKTIPLRLEGKREGEPASLIADNHLAGQLLNWKPKYSDLPTVIESAWKWHQLLIENAALLRTAMQRLNPSETVS